MTHRVLPGTYALCVRLYPATPLSASLLSSATSGKAWRRETVIYWPEPKSAFQDPWAGRKDRFPSARSSPRRAPPPGALLPLSSLPLAPPLPSVEEGSLCVCSRTLLLGLKPEPPCTPRPPAPGCPRLCCLGAAQTVKGSHQRNSSSQERAALDPKLLSVYRAQQGAGGSVRGGAGRLGGVEGVPRTLAVAFSYPYV